MGIVDIDAHQGNGTQAIFYDRADVLYGSVHVDPAAGWFPHVLGYADETGVGAGEGATRNLPLPEGTGDEPWLDAVADLAAVGRRVGCDALVVSLGVDAAADDPESPLQVTARRLPRGGPAARRDRAAGGGGPGGRLPPADPGRPRRGVPRRVTPARGDYIPGTGRHSSTSMDAPSIIRCGWPSSRPLSSSSEPASMSE